MTTDLKVNVISWNVAQIDPPSDLASLLAFEKPPLPEVYAIGLQELKSSTTSLVADSVFDDPWTNRLTKILCARGYVRVESIRLLGIHLVIFVSRKKLKYVTNVEKQYTRCGIGGLWGNKGAVSIRLEISGVNICFTNCHLAHTVSNVTDRIEQYDHILETQHFVLSEVDPYSILDHDYVFWFGDLNFRIDDISTEEVKKLALARECKKLWPYDQLTKIMKEELILVDFKEGHLNFPPTYKYDKGTDTYDTSSKRRKPAWCDRILWMVHEDSFEGINLGIEQVYYTSYQNYKQSDHKPVASDFVLKVLRDPPDMLVTFDQIHPWSNSGKATFTYKIDSGYEISSWDYIGLYRGDYNHFNDYITYIWAPMNAEFQLPDGANRYRISVGRQHIQECSGSICLCYYSAKKKCMIGFSEPFREPSSQEE